MEYYPCIHTQPIYDNGWRVLHLFIPLSIYTNELSLLKDLELFATSCWKRFLGVKKKYRKVFIYNFNYFLTEKKNNSFLLRNLKKWYEWTCVHVFRPLNGTQKFQPNLLFHHHLSSFTFSLPRLVRRVDPSPCTVDSRSSIHI